MNTESIKLEGTKKQAFDLILSRGEVQINDLAHEIKDSKNTARYILMSLVKLGFADKKLRKEKMASKLGRCINPVLVFSLTNKGLEYGKSVERD
jgi:predicted ArsR family transcriptional regulator